jgi:putative FmdB family regulatory protein
MPIYAYRCQACGFAKDVLQKISDPVLTVCLSCGQPTFKKQLTAAGFQLKGTGWYVTDFRNGNAPATAVAPAGESGGAAPADGKTGEAGSGKPATDGGTGAAAAASASTSGAAAAPTASTSSAPSGPAGASGDKK